MSMQVYMICVCVSSSVHDGVYVSASVHDAVCVCACAHAHTCTCIHWGFTDGACVLHDGSGVYHSTCVEVGGHRYNWFYPASFP